MPPKKDDGGDAKAVRFGRVRSNLKMGLVGLPNVGKSSLFNLLCQQEAEAANYPFCASAPPPASVSASASASVSLCMHAWHACIGAFHSTTCPTVPIDLHPRPSPPPNPGTINPNESRCAVPDQRFDYLCELFKPPSKIPAFLHVTDIAGLIKGASEGEPTEAMRSISSRSSSSSSSSGSIFESLPGDSRVTFLPALKKMMGSRQKHTSIRPSIHPYPHLDQSTPSTTHQAPGWVTPSCRTSRRWTASSTWCGPSRTTRSCTWTTQSTPSGASFCFLFGGVGSWSGMALQWSVCNGWC
jgi:hypothetical protein